MRQGYGRSLFENLLPLVLGRDVSGEVAAVGSGVRRLHVGQEVFGALHPTAVRGTYSEYSILAEDQLALKPPSLSHPVYWIFTLLSALFGCYASYIFS
jgi:NADPH:quinone reductase-like Zn-dependent oxidoreductase